MCVGVGGGVQDYFHPSELDIYRWPPIDRVMGSTRLSMLSMENLV